MEARSPNNVWGKTYIFGIHWLLRRTEHRFNTLFLRKIAFVENASQ